MAEILVIEDEPAIRNNIVRMLQDEGYATSAAGDGRAGVARAFDQRPDLIISDVLMPELDGFGVLDQVRSREDMAGVPFIFLTGLEDREHFRRGMGLGADDYLNKPFRRDELLQAVQVRLARAAAAGRREAERLTERERALQELFRKSLLGESQDKLSLDSGVADGTGEIRLATVLFSDIRDFTTISERLSAPEVATLLNAYFAEVCEPIATHGGRALKFIGDGVMAVFDPRDDVAGRPAARRALQAAMGMALAAHGFRDWLAANFGDRGLPDFAIGVGVHEGEVMLCSVGSRERREYTAIGDTVNLASRLEGKTKELGWSVIASRGTVVSAGEGIEQGRVRVLEVRGRTAPVEVVEVTGLAADPVSDDTLRVRLADDVREALRVNSEITARAVKAALATTQGLHELGLPAISGYAIRRCIGRGGMSRAYLARRAADGRELVLKLLDARTGDDELLHRFLQEYALLAHVDHPNVVRIYDQGITDELAYIAMEFFAGGDVRRAIEAGIDAPRAREILSHAAAGLAEIHRHGVVHRDVKPDNLMVRGDGSVALADFGIAKHARNSFASTRHGEILGTPYYLSPEQCQGLPATPQSDLYSLGVLAYEMLTGAKPYRARSVEELLALHRTAEVPRLPGEFASWQPLIDRLMAKRRDERFAQAADVLAWLQENP